jgi:hypothetical protein
MHPFGLLAIIVTLSAFLSCKSLGESPSPERMFPSAPYRPVFRGYEKIGTDMIIDPVAGLAWARTVYPRRMKLAAARSWVKGLKLGGFRDWRVPSYQELLTHQRNWGQSVPQEQEIDPVTGEVKDPEYPENWFRRFGFVIPQRLLEINNYWTVTPAPEATTMLGGKSVYTPIFGAGFTAFDTAMLADHAEAYVWAVRTVAKPADAAHPATNSHPTPQRIP